MVKKKGPIIKNTNKNNRHGTNCNDSDRVVVGRSPNDPIPYSWSVQKSVEHYICKYNLRCSLLQFPSKAPWNKLLIENRVSNEFLDAFANRINWSIVCRYQKLSENLMDKYAHLLEWQTVSSYQKISKKFICRHKKELNMDIVFQRFLITQKEIDQFDEMEGEEEIKDRFDILDM